MQILVYYVWTCFVHFRFVVTTLQILIILGVKVCHLVAEMSAHGLLLAIFLFSIQSVKLNVMFCIYDKKHSVLR